MMKDVKSHYGQFDGYKACSDGFIYSTHNWRGAPIRKMKGIESEHGYLRVTLKTSKNNNRRLPVHVLICSSFHGIKPSENHEVRHLDGDRKNNKPENLAWGTKSENAIDRSSHGLKFGRHGNNQKLTESDVIKIRESKKTNVELSKIYGVSDVSISNIKKRKTWRRL